MQSMSIFLVDLGEKTFQLRIGDLLLRVIRREGPNGFYHFENFVQKHNIISRNTSV